MNANIKFSHYLAKFDAMHVNDLSLDQKEHLNEVLSMLELKFAALREDFILEASDAVIPLVTLRLNDSHYFSYKIEGRVGQVPSDPIIKHAGV